MMTENIVRKSSPEMRSVRTENANTAAIISVTMLLTHKRPASRFCRRLFIGRLLSGAPCAGLPGAAVHVMRQERPGCVSRRLTPLIQLTRGGRRGHSAGCSHFLSGRCSKDASGRGDGIDETHRSYFNAISTCFPST